MFVSCWTLFRAELCLVVFANGQKNSFLDVATDRDIASLGQVHEINAAPVVVVDSLLRELGEQRTDGLLNERVESSLHIT